MKNMKMIRALIVKNAYHMHVFLFIPHWKCLIHVWFIDNSKSNLELVNKIVCFYKAAKKESEDKLQDGANQKP